MDPLLYVIVFLIFTNIGFIFLILKILDAQSLPEPQEELWCELCGYNQSCKVCH